jgi:hypothetical protein
MKTNPAIIPFLAAALVLAAMPISAADVMHERGSIISAEAKFQYVDTSDCSEGIVTNVTVLGFFGFLAFNGKARAIDTSAVGVSLVADDKCSGATVMFATGQTNENFDLRIDPNLNTATLHVRLLIHDYFTETSSYYDIDMVWTGIGKTQKQAIHDNEHSPDLMENEHVLIDLRDAVASGSVVSVSTGQNFTPGAPVSATLEKMQGGGNDVPIH